MHWLELVVILSLFVHGCGGGGTFHTDIDQGKVGGTWDLSLAQSGVSVRETKLSITQEKRFDPFSGTTSDNANLTGAFDGNNVVITLNNADGTTTTLTGAANKEWTTLSGTYSSTGSNGSGTWQADREVTPTPAPTALSVAPTQATLSCSTGQSQIFTVTGGTSARNYSVTAASNETFVTISTDTLTTDGKFTVTAKTPCAGTGGTIVRLNVTDNAASVIVPVTISNPLSVAPTQATLSCSTGQSLIFTVTGGSRPNYSVSASSNGSLVTISTDTLTTDGKFTVTAKTTCLGNNGATVNLNVTDNADNAGRVTVLVTISNP